VFNQVTTIIISYMSNFTLFSFSINYRCFSLIWLFFGAFGCAEQHYFVSGLKEDVLDVFKASIEESNTLAMSARNSHSSFGESVMAR